MLKVIIGEDSMLGERLDKAMKIAKKRWNRYHSGIDYWYLYVGEYPPIGIYKKSKGCECKGCTITHWIEKHNLKKRIRQGGEITNKY